MALTEEKVSDLLKLLLEDNPAEKALKESNAIIAETNKTTKEKQDGGVEIETIKSDQAFSFRRYKDKSVLGGYILDDLISKRKEGFYTKTDSTTKEQKNLNGYYLKESNTKVGLLGQLYGATGIFTLINRMDALTSNRINNVDAINAIKSSLYDILEYVKSYRYDMNPLIDDKTNEELFHKELRDKKGTAIKLQYVGAMTWALSFFVQTRTAIRKNLINFFRDDEEAGKKLTQNINASLFEEIKYIIEFFVENVIRDNETGVSGWGYANGCSEPSLFFTYSVIEAYSDFEDNVLLESDRDEELLEYLRRGYTKEEEYPYIKYKKLCESIGDKTWEIYKDTLKDNFFSDKFDGVANTVTKEEILKSGRSSALFNNLYIIFIMFYSSLNIREKDEEKRNKIVNGMVRSLQFVQNFYNDLKEAGNDSIVDIHIISFNQKNSLVPDFSKYLKDTSIQASSLLPMLVKANNLIAYWILKFPQQAMSELYDEMLNAKLKGRWLWEDPKYDLLSTERYIEAFADFYDYYNEYEAKYLTGAQQRIADDIMTSRDVKLRMKDEIDRGVNKLRSRVVKEAEKSVAEKVRADFVIENAINKRIEEKVAELIETQMGEYLNNMFSKLTEYNRQPEEKKDRVKLSEEHLAFKSLLENYIESYILNGENIQNASREYDVSKNSVKTAAIDGLSNFFKEYCNFIARHCEQRGDKASLAEIFKIIDGRGDNK